MYEECYTLWAMNHLRNPGSMHAALLLIQSCLLDKEFEDAERYARHAYFMVVEMTDNFIPSEQYPRFLADVTFELARSIFGLVKAGGIPPEEKKKVGEEVIEHARKALELHTQLYGTESFMFAGTMSLLADVLDYFNDVDDDEVLSLHEQSNDVIRRVEGNLSVNVAVCERMLGCAFENRARRAQQAANDLDRCIANLEQALLHYREALRIYRAINHVESVDNILCSIANVEEKLSKIRIARAAAKRG